MAMCSSVDDFSDSDELMELVKEITGKFICLLEAAVKYVDSENDNVTNSNGYSVFTTSCFLYIA